METLQPSAEETALRASFVMAVLVALSVSEARLQAYLDPGSGSMLLQLLLGGFAGAAVLARLA